MTIIRAPILRGVREVQALLFTGEMANDDALAHWDEGSALMQMAGGELLLRLPRPMTVRCEVGRAEPLVDDGGRLVALPLTPEQLDDAPPGSVVHLQHGRLVVEQPGPTLDPVVLLDLSGWQLESPVVATEARPAPQSAASIGGTGASARPRTDRVRFENEPWRARSPHPARRTRAAPAPAALGLLERPSWRAESRLADRGVDIEDL